MPFSRRDRPMTPRTSFQAAPIRSVVLRFASIYAPLLAATAGIVTTLYWTQDRAEHTPVMAGLRADFLAGGRVPQADLAVPRRGRDRASVQRR